MYYKIKYRIILYRLQEAYVGILGAVGCEGRNSCLLHYHETSGLAQTREELVHTTRYIYEILHCHTETCVPHREVLAPNIQILNIEMVICSRAMEGQGHFCGWRIINPLQGSGM